MKKPIYKISIFFMLALILFCVTGIMLFGIHSSVQEYFSMVIDMTGMVLSGILFVVCYLGNIENTTKDKIMSMIIGGIFLEFLFNDIIILFAHIWIPGIYIVEYLSYFISFFLYVLIWFYQFSSLPMQRFLVTSRICVFTLVGVYVGALILNMFTGVMFRVTPDGVVEYRAIIFECIVVFFMYSTYIIYIILQKCPLYKKHSLLSFAVLPMCTIFLSLIWSLCGGLYACDSIVIMCNYMSVLIVFFADYKYDKEEMIRERARYAEQQQKQNELQTAMMLSQIQPHFLYNALNAISSICEVDSANASQTIDRFAQYLRTNMHSLNEKGLVSFEKELEHTATYLEIEKLRFGDDLQVHYDIRYKDFSLPPLTLQPLVENAVKHGICSLEYGGIIRIASWTDDAGVHVTVRDNGPGFDTSILDTDSTDHIGVRNVRARLETMCGGTLTITSTPGTGTLAEIVTGDGSH